MAEVLAPTLAEDWSEALTAIALRTRDMFVRHPWARRFRACCPHRLA